jgi:hypothetical protein
VDNICNLLDGKSGVVKIQYCVIVRFVNLQYEVIVVRDDHSVSIEGILTNRIIVRSFPEFGDEVYVFDIVAVVSSR